MLAEKRRKAAAAAAAAAEKKKNEVFYSCSPYLFLYLRTT
jgi:hypothetical protein